MEKVEFNGELHQKLLGQFVKNFAIIVKIKDFRVVVCLFLVPSFSTDYKSSDLLFHFISLGLNTQYSFLTSVTLHTIS